MDDSSVIRDPTVRDEETLVRQRMRSGRLPPGPVIELYGGQGTRALCSCCDRVISADQIEFEIQVSNCQSEQLRLMMHSHCMRIWYDEWAP